LIDSQGVRDSKATNDSGLATFEVRGAVPGKELKIAADATGYDSASTAPTIGENDVEQELALLPKNTPSPPPPPRKGRIVDANVSFHTNSHPKRAETLVEVFVEGKTGKIVASIADAFQRFDKNTGYGPVTLKFDSGLDSVIAKSAHCRIHILNPKGVNEDDLWSFNYEIRLRFSNGETLRCSEMDVHLRTLEKQWSNPTELGSR
jgi:hypothetical protein